jgi:hypothetical protein
MRGPVIIILTIVLLAIGSIWIVKYVKEVRQKKKVGLSTRKLALSIQLNREQEEKVLDIELRTKQYIRKVQDSLKGNRTMLKTQLQKIAMKHTAEINALLDSNQRSKYLIYRKSMARKKARSLKLIDRKNEKKGVNID